MPQYVLTKPQLLTDWYVLSPITAAGTYDCWLNLVRIAERDGQDAFRHAVCYWCPAGCVNEFCYWSGRRPGGPYYTITPAEFASFIAQARLTLLIAVGVVL